jgi:hypothetical protein
MNRPINDAFSAAQPFSPEEPQALLRETPAGAPYPLDALGPLRDAAAAIHNITQAPPDIGAQSVLAVAALAAQGLGDAETLHGRAPASLFLLTIAGSGERKTAADTLAMRGLRVFEEELEDERRMTLIGFRNRLDIWESQRKKILSGKTGANDTNVNLSALGPRPEEPLSGSIIANEPTLEAITKNMPTLRASIGMFSDEGGAFIGGFGMSAENRLRTIAGFSSLWDGSPVNRWRAGDGVARHAGRRFAAHLMVQPVAAETFLADPVAAGQGFLARFLIAAPQSVIGTRTREGHSRASEAALDRFADRICAMLRRPLALREGTRNELSPPLIPMDGGARAHLRDFAMTLECEQAPGGMFHPIRPFASKGAEQAARIAAVLAAYAAPDDPRVTAAIMAGAISLATHALGEALRLVDIAAVSQETKEAEQLRRWLVEKWPEDFISASVAASRGCFKETEKNRRILGFLQRHGWVHPVEGGAMILGKHRREAWRINRGSGV